MVTFWANSRDGYPLTKFGNGVGGPERGKNFRISKQQIVSPTRVFGLGGMGFSVSAFAVLPLCRKWKGYRKRGFFTVAVWSGGRAEG